MGTWGHPSRLEAFDALGFRRLGSVPVWRDSRDGVLTADLFFTYRISIIKVAPSIFVDDVEQLELSDARGASAILGLSFTACMPCPLMSSPRTIEEDSHRLPVFLRFSEHRHHPSSCHHARSNLGEKSEFDDTADFPTPRYVPEAEELMNDVSI